MRRFSLFVCMVGVSALVAAPAGAQEQEATRWRVDAAEITLGGRVQAQLNSTSHPDEPDVEMGLRRVRLEATVRVNDLVSGRVQPDFAGDRVSLKDAYVQLNVAPTFQILAGQAHRPFSLIEMTSSTRILPVERGVRLRGVNGADQYNLVNRLAYSDRDVGIQLLGTFAGAPLRPGYRVGLFRGPLHQALGGRDSYQVAGRLTAAPVDGVRLGAALSSRDFADGDPSTEPVAVRRGRALSLDLEVGSFAPGLHFIGELTTGDVSPFDGSRFGGAQGWLAYRTGPVGRIAAVEPLVRVSHGSVDAGAGLTGGTLLTPGVNLHLGGRNRVMLNYDLWSGEEETHGGLKLLFQLAF